MKTHIKTVVLTVVLALFAGSGALAATGGRLPVITDSFLDQQSVNEDGYQNHGEDVSDVARDQEATGTKTTPGGKTIENHGQAVQEAAHEKDKGAHDSDSSDEEGDDTSDDTGEGGGNSENGNESQHGNSGANSGNNAGGNSANAHSE